MAQRNGTGDTGACPFPHKKKYTRTEAWAAYNYQTRYGRVKLNLWVYRCPAKGHHHLGSRKRK